MSLPAITAPSELEQVRSKTSRDTEWLPDRKILRQLALYPLLVESVVTETDMWGTEVTTYTYTGQYTTEQRVLMASADIIEEKLSDTDWDFVKVEDIEMRDNFHPGRVRDFRKRAGLSDFRIL